MIALQPLTFSEELAAKRKQLEMRAEKRKRGTYESSIYFIKCQKNKTINFSALGYFFKFR